MFHHLIQAVRTQVGSCFFHIQCFIFIERQVPMGVPSVCICRHGKEESAFSGIGDMSRRALFRFLNQFPKIIIAVDRDRSQVKRVQIDNTEIFLINRNLKENIISYANEMGINVFDTFIRESVAIRESQVLQKDLLDYSPRSKPAIDYKKLSKEILRRF